MKDLDKNKKYDLSPLNDEQLQTVLDWLKENDEGWEDVNITDLKRNSEDCNLHYNKDLTWHWIDKKECDEAINALELFKEEPNNYFITVNSIGQVVRKYPNCFGKTDLMKQYDECYGTDDIYSDIKNLIEKGKQHGLKIVVTFEEL